MVLFLDPFNSNSAVRGRAKKSCIDLLSLNNVGKDNITVFPTKLRVIIEEVVVWLVSSSTKLLALELKTCIFLDTHGAWRQAGSICGWVSGQNAMEKSMTRRANITTKKGAMMMDSIMSRRGGRGS